MATNVTATTFSPLPHESREEFDAFMQSIKDEFAPESPTEEFLVLEMARAQWKLRLFESIERALLLHATKTEGDLWNSMAAHFGAKTGEVLTRIDRLATSARRAWHRSFDTLQKFRGAERTAPARDEHIERNVTNAVIHEVISAPIPKSKNYQTNPIPETKANYETKPMPQHLERELAAHKRRDPLFDPKYDRSQMSKELQRWFPAA